MQDTMDTGIFELLLETGKAINAEIELEALVQRITDIGTELSQAQFGAFFYNVINQSGEKYVLYTISGVAKEAFSKFPMPRNTAIFHPTFAGHGTVRYDDVTSQPHFGKSAPYHGMPKGHLPVRSYLATSVISPVTKEVIGGLFFGHPDCGVFTERSERLIEGIAAQAAIAMGNAQLFEEKKQAEKRMAEQREQYKSIFTCTTDAMLIFDESGVVTDANPAALQLLEYPAQELIGKAGALLLKNEGSQFEAIQEIVRSGRQYKGRAFLNKKTGALVAAELIGSHFLHKDKKHVLLVVRDATRDQQTAAALKRIEAFSDTITKASPVALWMSNDKAEIIYVNQTWIDWTGKPLSAHLGYGWLDSILESDRERSAGDFRLSFERRKVFEAEFRIRRRDGAVRWCLVSGSPYYNQEGLFEGYSGSCMDITDRRAALEKLSSQNVLINTITNNTFQGLFMMNDRQYCTYMNPAAEQMIGYTLQEIQDKPLHYYIHHTHPDGRHFPIEECLIDRALPEKMQTQGEEVFIRKNGEFFPVAFVASPIIENGIPIGTVVEVRETTEEKRLQEIMRNQEKLAMERLEQMVKERTAALEKSNYELMQFTSVASHDLKEPVRKVSIFSNRLKELASTKENPQFHRYLDNIIASSGRMARLIDDLLAFSRLSHNNIRFEEVDLNVLLRQITDDLQVAIDEKKAGITYEHLPVIRGVPLQLGQVFLNLISNSLKFCDRSRSPEISISVKKEDRYWQITFTDNGIGFSNEHAEKIFDVFERLHSRDQYEGTGIGLAIVKKIIQQHGGTITAASIEGQGAAFLIRLPM